MRRLVGALVVFSWLVVGSVLSCDVAKAAHPPVPGEPCGPSLHLHHAVGIHGIDVICRGPIHHRFRWVVYIAPPLPPAGGEEHG